MIIVQTDRTFSAYYRTNRRVRWNYSEYAGCWETLERAIEEIESTVDGQRAEYMIENMITGETHKGFIN